MTSRSLALQGRRQQKIQQAEENDRAEREQCGIGDAQTKRETAGQAVKRF